MNENFLYELRSPPPPEFARRLKARLDQQASEARQKRRAFKWFVLGAIMMGGTALAFVSPSVREASLALIMQLRGSPVPRATEYAPARDSARPTGIRASSPFVALPENDGTAPLRDTEAMTQARVPSEIGTAKPNVAMSPAGGESRTTIATASQPRSTVRLSHSKPLAALAEAVATEIEGRLHGIDIVTQESPETARPCERDPRGEIVLSEQRLYDDGFGCGARRRYAELPFAYTAVVIVIHRENTWARSIALTDLQRFDAESPTNPLTTWSQLRTDWPTLPIVLVGPAFRQSDVGGRFARAFGLQHEPAALRRSRDDRGTLAAIEEAFGAIGFVSFNTLEAVRKERSWPTTAAIVNAGGEAVEPSENAIQDGSYALSSRVRLFFAPRQNGFATAQVLREVYAMMPLRSIEASGFVAMSHAERGEAARKLRELQDGSGR